MRRAFPVTGAGLLCAILLAAAGSAGSVRADPTTVGVTVNGTSGLHVTETQAKAVPFVPLPVFEIEHRHKNLIFRAEIVPPVGPIPLAQGADGFGVSQEPRLNYFDVGALYAFGGGRYALGIGETVVNQRTIYPPSPVEQASRVVGARYMARMLVPAGLGEQFEVNVAIDPSLQGVQYTLLPPGFLSPGSPATVADPERGSLVDASVRWKVRHERYTFSYGIRYLNYVAFYTANQHLADRNHLLMPFVGFDWKLGRARYPQTLPTGGSDPLAPHGLARVGGATFGFTLGGTSGSQTATFNDSAVPLVSSVVPIFRAGYRHGRFEVRGEGVFPRAQGNPFGSQRMAWSYLHGDLLYWNRTGRYALGIGDTAINQHLLQQFPGLLFSQRHAEGMRYTVTGVIAARRRERLDATLSVTPHLDVTSSQTLAIVPPPLPCSPPCPPPFKPFVRTFVTRNFGSLVDASLGWSVPRPTYTFAYGLRYFNESVAVGTVHAAPGAPTELVDHYTSLMPFVGISTHLGH